MEKFYNIDEQRFWDREDVWTDAGHEWSGSFGTTENLWNREIFDSIKMFRGKDIVELAPGFGRITQFLSILAGKLTVVDLNPLCIKKTQEKLGHHVASYHVNDGKTLTGVNDESQDLVFSFDSCVHMHANVINEYIKEAYRVLRPGGQLWIHHSNFQSSHDLSFKNVAGRSAFDHIRFNEFAKEAGFKILSNRPIQFDPVAQWDGIDYISTCVK